VTALSDALLAAQKGALNATAKQIQAGKYEGDFDSFRLMLDTLGCNDRTEQEQLWSALDVIKKTGAQVPKVTERPPASYSERRETEKATEAQMALIERLVRENGLQAPDTPLSKVDASRVIEQIKAGEYDPAAWTVPF
jgi:hypothetical protein